MTVFTHTSDTIVTTDGSQVDLLADFDDLIVGREATLLATGLGSVVVRAASGNSMFLNGEMVALEQAILATGGNHEINVGVDGVISSLQNEAIRLGGGDNIVFNAGQLAGQESGLDILGGDNEITNTGLITGQDGEALDISEGGNTISNAGTIAGVSNDGIIIGGDGGNVIVNTGTISGVGDDGMQVSGIVGATNRLVNSGTVSTDSDGDDFSYNGSDATDVVVNRGLMVGDVSLEIGADRLNTRFGLIEGDVFGGDGSDTLTGGDGDDAFFGEAGTDVLRGNGGNDVLNGGLLRDTLSGGAGADTFQFDSAVVGANTDTILDFVVKDDTIELDNSVFTGLAEGTLKATAFRIGAAAADANDRIVYNDATGALLFDADGNGAGAAVKFATIDKGLALTNLDFFVI